MEQDLASALKDTLISKDEFTKKIAETQHDLLYGLESKVLDKVRNDPVIMERMTVLAHQTGQQFSKGSFSMHSKMSLNGNNKLPRGMVNGDVITKRWTRISKN